MEATGEKLALRDDPKPELDLLVTRQFRVRHRRMAAGDKIKARQ